MEVLDRMNSARILDALVFGGGTMLRLCHGLGRYSADLDFWFAKQVTEDAFFEACRTAFGKVYEITDQHIKHYTILFELRSAEHPRRLKIEIRREWGTYDCQQTIAHSRFSTRQVILRAHTLYQTMANKIRAFLDRGEIRDCFDIEFMLRRGIEMIFEDREQIIAFQKKLAGLKDLDYKVKLGSIVEEGARRHFVADRFGLLRERLGSLLV